LFEKVVDQSGSSFHTLKPGFVREQIEKFSTLDLYNVNSNKHLQQQQQPERKAEKETEALGKRKIKLGNFSKFRFEC